MIAGAGALAMWKEIEGLGHVQSGEEAALDGGYREDADSSPWCVKGGWKISLNWNKKDNFCHHEDNQVLEEVVPSG